MRTAQEWLTEFNGHDLTEAYVVAACDNVEWGNYLPAVDRWDTICGLVDVQGTDEYQTLILVEDQDGGIRLVNEPEDEDKVLIEPAAARI